MTQSVVRESISAVAAGADSVDNFEADFDAAAVEAYWSVKPSQDRLLA